MDVHKKIKNFIYTWEGRGYSKGIPDAADPVLESFGKVPSYRRICLAILQNDWHLVGLGYQRPISRAYSQIKRMEILSRPATKKHIDLFGEQYECT